MWDKLTKKITVRCGDTVIKLREERQLLSRFLLIVGSRPQLVPKLSDVIGKYEMAVVPRSLVAVDGSLYIPKDKSSLMKMIEGGQSQNYTAHTGKDMASKRVLIVDAMEVVQSITKTTKMTKVIHFQEEFLKKYQNS